MLALCLLNAPCSSALVHHRTPTLFHVHLARAAVVPSALNVYPLAPPKCRITTGVLIPVLGPKLISNTSWTQQYITAGLVLTVLEAVLISYTSKTLRHINARHVLMVSGPALLSNTPQTP